MSFSLSVDNVEEAINYFNSHEVELSEAETSHEPSPAHTKRIRVQATRYTPPPPTSRRVRSRIDEEQDEEDHDDEDDEDEYAFLHPAPVPLPTIPSSLGGPISPDPTMAELEQLIYGKDRPSRPPPRPRLNAVTAASTTHLGS